MTADAIRVEEGFNQQTMGPAPMQAMTPWDMLVTREASLRPQEARPGDYI